MFSMCSKAAPQTPSNLHPHGSGPVGKQIKGGYLLRHKRQLLCVNRWVEEYVVLYDDSTMAWFSEPSRTSPVARILVKEAPEMLAIAQWTGQIPKRPSLPHGSNISQLIALGSKQKKSKVFWMVAKSEVEANDWINAISKTLPPAPQIELVIDKSQVTGTVKRPLVRVRFPTTAEVTSRRNNRDAVRNSQMIRGDATIAILSRSTNDSETKATLACVLPWGHGVGWSSENGIWAGGLTWTQCEDTFTLHALPITHCTNYIETPHMGVYHTDIGAFDFHTSGIDDMGGDDFDYAVDVGDFIF